jgi:DNA invertase Pin-like site-specific DNA recombinase
MRGKTVDVGYARVSTRDQDLTIQLTALERAGCDEIYQEKRSGAEGKDQPVRDEILAQLQPADTLTVWKIDRAGRSLAELLAIVKDLEARRIGFRCVTQPVDTTTSSGKLFLQLLAAFAEFEREMILERTAAGRERRRAEGKPWGPPVFGFAADHTTIIEDQAALLREAAERALDGEPLSRITDDFNARGYRPGKATRWRVTHLRRILANPKTAAIVGQDRHEELVRLFAGRDRQRQGRPAEHLLSGILVCGRDGCGQPLYAATKGGKDQPAQLVYRCKKATGYGGRFNGCGSTVVSLVRADAWAVEAFVAAAVSDDFAEP